MKTIEYAKILDVQWALRRAELKAKSEWDKTVQYGKDDLLYELAYDKVKELRAAQQHVDELSTLLSKNDQLEYSG